MKVKIFARSACLIILGFASLLHAAEKPNIVFVYTDDQAPWALGRAGNPQAHTPNMDRLCRQGAYLPNFCVTTPVCSPARAGLLVSRYGTEVGITDWINPGWKRCRDESDLGLDTSLVTWTELLADAGYTNGLIGKWHLGTADRYHPKKSGYHTFVGFREGGNKVKDPTLEVGGEKKKHQGLLTDILTDYAIEFLRANKGRPFALSLHYRAPHAPWLPVAPEDWAPYGKLDPTIPNPDYPKLDIPRVKKMMREYLASVAGVDRNLGRLLAALDELKLADRTVVIFTSDHGYNMGHNGIWHKGNGHWITTDLKGIPGYDPRVARPNLYDNSLRVPTIIRWPGVLKPGTVIKQTISNLDWYPTLVSIAGAKLPAGQVIRGRNFLPLLRGRSIEWDNDLYAQYSQHHYTEADLRMYRTPEWKLVRDFKNGGKDELYHLAKDPSENHNRIDAPECREIRKRLNAKLLAKMREISDPALPRHGRSSAANCRRSGTAAD